jgi:hypothetical protein
MNAKMKKIINWCLFAASVVLVVSGYGIVKFKIVGPLFGGLLDKSDFFKIHSFLALPFIFLLVLHVFRIKLKK